MPTPSNRELNLNTPYALHSIGVRNVNVMCASTSKDVRDSRVNSVSAAMTGDNVIWTLAADDNNNNNDINDVIYNCALSSDDVRDVNLMNTLTLPTRDCGIRGRPGVKLPPAPNPSIFGSNSKVSNRAPATEVVGDVKNDDDDDDVEYVMSVLSDCSIEKFDSGASRCMSGNPNRLTTIIPNDNRVKIVGFNNTTSEPSSCGYNADNKEEYYVSDMPSDLTLLCANAYCQDGCAILFANDGLVLRMSESELSSLKEFLKEYPVVKYLKVQNRTYEVNNAKNPANTVSNQQIQFNENQEEALQGTATRFFNTKVNVSNQTERILTLLMTGLSFRDWQMHVKHGSLGGIPPDLTSHGLNRFEYRYGRTPDIVRLAHPISVRDSTGLRDERTEPTRTGERIEIDCLYSDYNIRESVTLTSDNKLGNLKTRKLPTHGGAISGAVCVDCYSSFVHGQLLKSVAHPETFVEGFLSRLKLDDVLVRTLAADGGVVTNSMFQVLTTKVEHLCTKWNIKSIERSEPYSHARITGSVEREIGIVKSLIRLAITLILRNPNFPVLGFTSLMIFKLWGEFFLWAINIINLKPCPRVPSKSRYEVYYNKVPNMQDIRILPIGCVIVVVRPYGHEDDVTSGVLDNQKSGQIGIYVGPSMLTPGCVRVAVVSRGKLMIITTSNFRSASDGGGLNVYPHIERGVQELIAEYPTDKITVTDAEGSMSEPEADHTKEYEELGVIQQVMQETEIIAPETGALQQNIGKKKSRGRKKNKKKNSISTTLSNSSNSLSSILPLEISQDIILLHDVPLPVTDSNIIVDSDVNDQVNNTPSIPIETTLCESPNVIVNHIKRSSRIQDRRERLKDVGNVAIDTVELETCCLADWSTHENECIYWSWTDFSFVKVSPELLDTNSFVEEGYRAVTVGVPKSFEQALKHPVWGVAAQKEINTIFSAKAMVEVNAEIARNAIYHDNADLMYLFPVYEEKLKEGVLINKVRLVADGRTHHHAGDTYSATPSREELFILMHLIAALDWDYAHIDEVRAFLKAPYKGKNRAFAKFRGGSQYYEIFGALYGLKTAPRDYQEEVAKRLETLGFTRLVMCSCIYILKRGNDVVIVYDYVDDFIFTGNNRHVIDNIITEFRTICETTEPIWDAERVLGMEFNRVRNKRIIKITMTAKIVDVCSKTNIGHDDVKNIPMPISGYIVKDYEFESMKNLEEAEFLNSSGISEYMAIVGGLIWISGLRLDITFATMYLAWNTKMPRRHHMRMARCVLSYLNKTQDLPLVLGGSTEVNAVTFSDASLGTGPKGRSVLGNLTKLNEKAGAVSANSKATNVVFTSSFEVELDGATRGLKSNSRVVNVLTELGVQMSALPHLWSDNKAMVNFIHGEGVAKGVRHMELRMWYVRERYKQGNVVIDWMLGEEMPADKLTKLGSREEHEVFTRDIMGLGLLE